MPFMYFQRRNFLSKLNITSFFIDTVMSSPQDPEYDNVRPLKSYHRKTR